MSIHIKSVVDGMSVRLETVNDAEFSQKLKGDGVAIIPDDGIIKAPFDALIKKIPDTKNAITLVSDTGVEMLIHIGLGTEGLNGEHFNTVVKEGQHVKENEDLIYFDIDTIFAKRIDPTVLMLIQNQNNYSKVFAHINKHLTSCESIALSLEQEL